MFRAITRVALIGCMLSGVAHAGDPQEYYNELKSILEQITNAKSDPEAAEDFVDDAAKEAKDLAQDSCDDGLYFDQLPGTLVAARLLRQIGAVALHRHGSQEAASEALVKAKEIYEDEVACISGNEATLAIAEMDRKSLTAVTMNAGVPTEQYTLLINPDPNNHCNIEDPKLKKVYDKAKKWVNANVDTSPGKAKKGGSVTCLESDPDLIWRVEVLVKDHGVLLTTVPVRVNIETWDVTP